MTLLPLTDAPCPKCGGTLIGISYREAGDYGIYGGLGWKDGRIADMERIEKYCRRCGYQWAEAVKSAEGREVRRAP